MPVTLIGLMGAGKSKVGRRAAELLGRPFVDTDVLVAEQEGRSVAEIFASDGEVAFRRMERAAIRTALATPGAVVAVGGGAVLDRANVAAMRDAGPVIWLYAEPSTLVERLRKSIARGDRPLLAGGDPLQRLTALLDERRNAYAAAATVTLRTDGLSVPESADVVVAWIREHLDGHPDERHVAGQGPAGTGRIRFDVDPPYDAVVGHGLLDDLARHLPALPDARRAAVITTDPVERHHAAAVTAGLKRAGLDVHLRTVPDGEAAKSLGVVGELYDWLAAIPLGRLDVVVGLGGGAVTDLAGFVAATWNRGVAVVQIPTTLLGQVDAAIGGKTGINVAAGKNLVGAFHQPAVVVADIATLATLPARELRAGMAEVVKCGYIRDTVILDLVGSNPAAALDPSAAVLAELVRRAATVKAQVVAADTREHGERALLNYGHTFAHALETLTEYRRHRHGEAVALGMRFAAFVAELRGSAAPGLAEDMTRLLTALGLPTTCEPLDPEAVWEVMARDKKARDGIRLVLCDQPGSAYVTPAPDRTVMERALQRLWS